MDLRGVAERIFRIRPGAAAAHVNAVTGLEPPHTLADRVHHARAINARRVRQRRFDGVGARAHVGIGGIDAGGADVNQDLPGSGRGLWCFLEELNFRPPKLMDADGFHGISG